MSMFASSGSDFILEGLTPCCYGVRNRENEEGREEGRKVGMRKEKREKERKKDMEQGMEEECRR